MEKSIGKLECLDPLSCSDTGILISSGFNEFDAIVLDHNSSAKYSNSVLQNIQIII
jgi:hypothetical protein